MSNNMREYLKWLCCNLDAFEFRTLQAQELRDEIRRWRYSDDADGQWAERLYTEFFKLFSDNPFIDMISGDICHMAERSAIPQSKELQGHMALVHKDSAIVGRSLRAYGGIKEVKAAVWLQTKATAARSKLEPLLKSLRSHMSGENFWRRAKRLSIFTPVILLLFMGSVAYGCKALWPLMLQLFDGKPMGDILNELPARALMSSDKTLQIAYGGVLFALVMFFVRIRHIFSSLRGYVTWLTGYKKSLRRRTNFAKNLSAGFSESALKATVNEMGRTYDKCKDTPNNDATRAYFTEAAKVRLFYKKKKWKDNSAPARWEKLYENMNRRCIRYRFLYLLLAAFTFVCSYMLLADRADLQDRIEAKEEAAYEEFVQTVWADVSLDRYYEGSDGLVGEDGLVMPELTGIESDYPYGVANITYIPEFALDSSRETGWATSWIGESVWLEYSFPKSQFHGIQLANGCQYNEGVYYYTFCRACDVRMEVYCDGELVNTFYGCLEDITDWQFFMLSDPLEATAVRLYIDSVYTGEHAVFLTEAVPLVEG